MLSMMKVLLTTTISSKTLNLDCITLKNNSITILEFQQQQIRLDTLKVLWLSSLIQAYKGTSLKDLINISSLKIKLSLYGEHSQQMDISLEPCRLTFVGLFMVFKISSLEITLTKICAEPSKATSAIFATKINS